MIADADVALIDEAGSSVQTLWCCVVGRVYCSPDCKKLHSGMQDMLHSFKGGPQRLPGLPMLGVVVTDGHHSRQVPHRMDVLYDALTLLETGLDSVVQVCTRPWQAWRGQGV